MGQGGDRITVRGVGAKPAKLLEMSQAHAETAWAWVDPRFYLLACPPFDDIICVRMTSLPVIPAAVLAPAMIILVVAQVVVS